MWDVRLVTLYKQHYMDRYNGKLDCAYSCWGYYDGLDITEIESKQSSSLLMKDLNASISGLWYKSGEKIREITGLYGSINIGLFRYENDKDSKQESFWDFKEKMPFFGISFLQLDEPVKYQQLGQAIEGNMDVDSEKKCYVITYCTYDNADLVLLVTGNSLSQIEKKLQEIDSMPEIRYQHSVIGVSEQYLSDCQKSRNILDCWKETKCFVEETVLRLDVRLVTSGEPQIVSIEKNILDKINEDYAIKNYEKATYSHVLGHENVILSIPETDVKTMLIFLLQDGFATHQNKSYAQKVDSDNNKLQPRVFNIETLYILNSNLLNSFDDEQTEKEFSPITIAHNWFQEKIDEYQEKSETALLYKDESLYAYYLAMLRTLNVLAQYERFSLSEDIFYLLYPSFKMFDEKLNNAFQQINDYDSSKYYSSLFTIKQSMCEFLEGVNSVIYHTIHTDQVYLMVPGYSGTSFSIPIKLNLFFLWFTDCVARLLGNKGRKYRCILIPTMEATPATHWMKLEEKPDSFLVCAKISQRTLYIPDALMIILAHEMGHYIGGDLRCRKKRSVKLTEFAIEKLIDHIFIEETDNAGNVGNVGNTGNTGNTDVSSLLIKHFKEKAEEIIRSQLDKMKEKGYYGDDVVKMLKSACSEVLLKCGAINSRNLIKIFPGQENFNEMNFYQLYRLLDRAESKAEDILIHNTMSIEIEDEMKVYKEIFSDLVAVRLLECDKKAFEEAYRVSQGMDLRVPEIELREKVMEALGKKIGWIGWNSNEDLKLSEREKLLYDYLAECNVWLNEKFETMDSATSNLLNEIRQLYKLFALQTVKEKCEGNTIYDEILLRFQRMKSEIDEEIKNDSRGVV